MSDLSAEQIRAARGLLRWSQEDLAEHSGVSTPTIKRLEGMADPVSANAPTIQAIRQAMEKGGVEFLDENGGGAGVRLAKRKRK